MKQSLWYSNYSNLDTEKNKTPYILRKWAKSSTLIPDKTLKSYTARLFILE